MKNIFQISRDVSGSYNGWYTCPECGKANLVFAHDQRHECSCGKFLFDIGLPLQTFISDLHAQNVPMAAGSKA